MNKISNLSSVIAFAVVNDKLGLITFLNNNLVPVKNPITDEELVATTAKSLLSDSKIQQNFIQWLSYKTKSMDYKNSNGFTDPGFNFDSSAFGTSGTSSTTTSTTSSDGGGFWSGFNASAVSGIISSGLNFFGNLQASENNLDAIQAQANAQIAASQSEAQSASANLQAAQLNYQAALAGQKPNSNVNTTVLIAAIVGGTLLLGTTIFLITRKK